MSDEPIICEALQELAVERRFVIKLINRHTNAAAALVRRVLGWGLHLPEKERDAIKKRAANVTALVFAGKELPPADEASVYNIRKTLGPVVLAIKPLQERRNEVEKDMEAKARLLPVHAWQKGVVGFGDRGLAVLIGETGDLSKYPNFRHVWKRLGLMPIEGRACSQWRRSGKEPPGGWKAAGYSPHRRAEIYACTADPMAKKQLKAAAKTRTEFGEPIGPYGDVYVERRKKTKLEHPDWTKKHAQMDALRIMTKALVSDLWSEWRGLHMRQLKFAAEVAAPAEIRPAEAA